MDLPLKSPVLIVEDSLEMRATLRMCLEELGFQQVFEADSVRAARSQLNLRKHELILADWNMPEQTGMDFLKIVRSSAVHRRVPYIMVTGYPNRKLVNDALKLGVSGFVAKPFEFNALSKAIKCAQPAK